MSIENYVAQLSKPSSAPAIDGVCLEDIIPGYRTLSVSGRDPLELNLTTVDRDKIDGEIYRWKKLQARTITINFAITTSTLSAYRASVSKLKAFCHQHTNSKYIFRDQPDRYIVGTVESIDCDDLDNSGMGAYAGEGSISVHCSDPIFYSVEEYTVTGDPGEAVSFNYDGTYPAYPRISVTNGDGLTYSNDKHVATVVITNKNGGILSFGDNRTITEKSSAQQWATLLEYGEDRTYGLSGNSLSDLLSKGKANSDNTNKWWVKTGYNGAEQDGTISYRVTGGQAELYPSAFNDSGTNTWLGTSMRWEMGAAPDGTTAFRDYEFKFDTALIATDRLQTGGIYCGVEDEKGQQITGMYICKNSDNMVDYNVMMFAGPDITMIHNISGRSVGDAISVVGNSKSSASSSVGYDVDAIANKVIRGDYGNGQDRVNRLKAAGYDPNIIQNRVNQLLGLNSSGQVPAYDKYANNTGVSNHLASWGSEHAMYRFGSTLVMHFYTPEYYPASAYGVAGDTSTSPLAKYIVLGFTQLRGYEKMAVQGLQYIRVRGVYSKVSTSSHTVTVFLSARDTLTADCSNATVEVNGLSRPTMNALGNDWSKFKMEPGTIQQIAGTQTNSSGASVGNSKVTVAYRKAYV